MTLCLWENKLLAISMSGFYKHFHLDASTAHGRHRRSYNQHQDQQWQHSPPAKLCPLKTTHSSSEIRGLLIWELLVWKSCAQWKAEDGLAALAPCERHLHNREHIHLLDTSLVALFSLFSTLLCWVGYSEDTVILLEVHTVSERLQYHAIMRKREHLTSITSLITLRPLQSPLSNSVFSQASLWKIPM